MILRGFQVENWRCIRSLAIADLPAGIVVLHGPNRIGKSSLVRALRACLFDADHDSTKEEIGKSLPWSGTGPPRVAVEFTTAGSDYRITKVFSRRKDGLALLEKKSGDGWQVEEDAPKEASRRVRELLGAERSTAGLNQLLWLAQGDVKLPGPDRVDAALEKQLAGVLGALITGADLAFQQALEKRYQRWYTEKDGRFRKDSQVSQWEQERAQRLQEATEARAKFEKWEEAIRQLEALEDGLPECRRDVALAETEVRRLEAEQEQCRERLQHFRAAEQACTLAAQELARAEKASQLYQEAQSRLAESDAEVARSRQTAAAAQEECARLKACHAERLDALQQTRTAEESQLLDRQRSAQRKELLDLTRKAAELAQTRRLVEEREQEIGALQSQLQELSAPDEAALRSLRENRRLGEQLRAQLQAAAMALKITPSRPASLTLAIDGAAARTLELTPEQTQAWSVCQKVELTLGDFGTIELARGQAGGDLERTAGQLAELDRYFGDGIKALREDPEDPACLDRLTERRILRESANRRLQAARQELRGKAPQGLAELEAERKQIEAQRDGILQRRPELASWLDLPDPSQRLAEVEAEARAVEARAAELKQQRTASESAEAQARQALEKAGARLAELQRLLAAATAAAQHCREELARLGNEPALQQALDDARRAQAAAVQARADRQLSEAELTIDRRHEAALAELQKQQERLRLRENELHQLRGFLQGNEGLHARLADAEAGLQVAEQALAREQLEAEAHRRLRLLFAECRENQVQQAMAPLAGRVLGWARDIGLDEYHEVCFGNRFVPEGIVLGNGTPLTLPSPPRRGRGQGEGAAGPRVSFDDESYGTAEQLSLLVRLALGGVLAKDEPVVALLDDPLAHTDAGKHQKIIDVLCRAAAGDPSANPPAGPLQIIVLTCHPERFESIPGAARLDLAARIVAQSHS